MTDERIAHLVKTFEVARVTEARARRIFRRFQTDEARELLHLAELVTKRAAIRLSNAVARATRR